APMSAFDTFFSAWADSDAASRAATISSSYADGGTYADPRSGDRLSGDGIADYVGMFSANAPGWGASVVKADDSNGYHRLLVVFGGKGPDGSDMVQHGTYFGELDSDGKITVLAGFVGVASAE
ncbi:MAG: hypothetical protein ACPG5U_10765, partial [Planktomarina sp.]